MSHSNTEGTSLRYRQGRNIRKRSSDDDTMRTTPGIVS